MKNSFVDYSNKFYGHQENKLDGFTGSASKLNFTNNVTSDIQAQINAVKANIAPYTTVGNLVDRVNFNISGTNFLEVLTSDWYLVVIENVTTGIVHCLGSPMYLPEGTILTFTNALNNIIENHTLYYVRVKIPYGSVSFFLHTWANFRGGSASLSLFKMQK